MAVTFYTSSVSRVSRYIPQSHVEHITLVQSQGTKAKTASKNVMIGTVRAREIHGRKKRLLP